MVLVVLGEAMVLVFLVLGKETNDNCFLDPGKRNALHYTQADPLHMFLLIQSDVELGSR